MSVQSGLEVIVVYGPTTSDFPDEFVARAQWAESRWEHLEIVRSPELFARGKTLDEVRRQIHEKRPGLVCVTRAPSDDPVIVESWL